MNQVESLIDLLSNEYDSSPKGFDHCLMVWRGMLILLQLECLHEWSWNHILIQSLKVMHKAYEELRRQKDGARLIDYLRYTLDTSRMMGLV